jgi:hypothetical protein
MTARTSSILLPIAAALVTALAAGASFAQTTALTRADVQADVIRAKATGTMPVAPESRAPQVMFGASSVSRAEVRAQAIAAMAKGTIGLDYERQVPQDLRGVSSGLTRAQVQADLALAMSNGSMPSDPESRAINGGAPQQPTRVAGALSRGEKN